MQGHGVLLQQTEQFINDNPTDVVFTRHTKVSDGAGGSTTTSTPLSAQTVRIVQAGPSGSVERQNQEGTVDRPDLTIVAMPDADLQRGDTFTWQSMNAQVTWVRTLDYELLADVAVR